MGLLLAAKVGEQTEFVGGLVAVVEIDIDALPQSGAALAEILANQTAQRRASRSGAKAMYKTDPDAGGVGLGRGQPPVVLKLTRQVGLRDVIEERGCRGRD